MKALVTGGSGFIGSHVVDRLLAEGHEARVFDLLPWCYEERDGCEAVAGDLLDPEVLRAAAEGCDVIVHLAAAADVGLVAKNPTGSERLNARGTLNVLEAARETGARVVYASTIWVYSDVVEPEVDEDSQLALPSHLYTATKLAGEMYCRAYEQLYEVQTTVLRFGIPYGPRARPAAVLPIFVNKALAGEPLTIAGDGMQTRRFVYVEDLADGVVRALAPQAIGRVYNLVSDEDTSVVDIAEAVRDAVGDIEITHVEGRSGDFAGARVSGERAARELGWRARTPFAEGVRRYVAWHREQAADPVAPAPPAPAPVAVTPVAPQPVPVAPQPVPVLAAATAAVAEPPPAPRAARPVSAPAGIRAAAHRASGVIGGLLALLVYAYVLSSAGLPGDDEHSVIVIAVLALASTVSIASTQARVAVWVVALAGAVLLIPARTSGALDLSRLNPGLLALGLAGAGFALLAVKDGRRRTLELSLAEHAER
ncbi:MAG: UDP-glucose 4-epimerase [Solirubrobacteraceae bacterium]|nr:UDP-glucose 4-epimerase [Solirubrobacteraceae bacterium]